MKLDAKKQQATVSLDTKLDADGIEQLIIDLAELRAQMNPPVPDSRGQLPTGKEALIEQNPSMAIAARRNGGFRIWARNRGIGWMAFEIDDITANGIAGFIGRHAAEAGPNLFGKGDAHSH